MDKQQSDDHPTILTSTESRQAVKVHKMRYVLGFGIAGAIAALISVWVFS